MRCWRTPAWRPSAPINLTMVGADGRPVQKNLRTMLEEWIDFRLATVTRRTQHRLDKVLARIHILEGRQLVLLNIDEVIAIIRRRRRAEGSADRSLQAQRPAGRRHPRDPPAATGEAGRHRDRTGAEGQAREQQAALDTLLGSDTALRKAVVKEIEADAKTHGDARRTIVQEDKRAVAEIKVIDEPVTVIASQKGWVRTMKGHEVDAQSLGLQVGRRAVRHLRLPQRRFDDGLWQQWPRLHGGGRGAAGRARRWRAGHVADRP